MESPTTSNCMPRQATGIAPTCSTPLSSRAPCGQDFSNSIGKLRNKESRCINNSALIDMLDQLLMGRDYQHCRSHTGSMLLKLNIVVHLNTIRLVNDYNKHNVSDSAVGIHNNVVDLDEEIEKG